MWSLLAQAGETGAATGRYVNIPFIWEQITTLSWLQAVLAVSFGMVYLLYGWRIFRILVVLSFALLGMFIGINLGDRAGSPIWGGVAGFILLAVLAVPLMKWCVSILGAAAGGILTGGIWYALGLPEAYIWAGALVGAVAGGMLSFIVLKASVMLFTSMGGSLVLAIGMLSLLHQYEMAQGATNSQIYDLVHHAQWFLPVMLLVPTVVGIIAQNKLIKQSSKWEF